jgi:carbonic anhydrase/acetyltransferase-like protein (isoleucine patch superfamily)
MNKFKKTDSTVLCGSLLLGQQVYVAQGAVVRSVPEGVIIGDQSAVLENAVIAGGPYLPVRVGAKTVFGHRAIVVGASVGNLCEIGNNSIIMPGSTVGSWCILGEGSLVKAGARIPDASVVVGRPGKVLR